MASQTQTFITSLKHVRVLIALLLMEPIIDILCNLDMADEGIRSPFFHGYCVMIDIIAFVVLWVSVWYDSCSCHSEQLTADKMNSWRKRGAFRERMGGECVMNSRRGPDFACGDMLSCLRGILNMSNTALLAGLAYLGLDQASIGSIMQEFGRARQHLWFTMSMKHSYWSHEPWIFFGIAHRAERIARAYARKCLRLRHRILRNPLRPIHYITKLLLFTQRFLEQLQLFANGEPMENLKELGVLAAMFRFAYTSDLVFVFCYQHLEFQIPKSLQHFHTSQPIIHSCLVCFDRT